MDDILRVESGYIPVSLPLLCPDCVSLSLVRP
jgi:hypothetical protein